MEENQQTNGETVEKCDTKEKKCCCKKFKCVVIALIFIFSLVSMAFAFEANRRITMLLNAAGVDINNPPQNNNFLISKKYDRGQSLDKALETKKPIIAFFYVDWCGYCKKFAPVFDKIVKTSAIKDKFAIAYINCENEPATAEKYEIKGFPTVYLMKPEGKEKQLVDNNHIFGSPEALKSMFLEFTK